MSTNSIKIRNMKEGDIDFCYYLSSELLNWDFTKEDWKRTIEYEPEGCFVAEIDGQSIGSITTIIFKKIAHLGMLIILPEVRGKGIGAQLMEHAIEFLENQGVESIKLDSVEKAVTLYKKYDFKIEFKSLRYRGVGKKLQFEYSRRMRVDDLEDVYKIDQEFSGLNRSRILKRIFEEFKDLCFVVYIENKIIGYIMAKKSLTMYKIGPWICRPDFSYIAEDLLKSILNETEKCPIWIGILKKNQKAVEIINKHDFQESNHSTRMVRSQILIENENYDGIFSIGSPEKS